MVVERKIKKCCGGIKYNINIDSIVVTDRVCDAVKLGSFEEHLSVQSVSSFLYKGCPTTYQIRQSFNNFTTNEIIATKFETDFSHRSSSILTHERTPVQVSFQYLHWFYNY
jgi:hypothetical protein